MSGVVVYFFFFKQKTAYEMLRSLVGSEMCIRDSLKHIGLTADMIQDMIQERLTARKNKEFKRADEIREKFLEKGIVLLDTPKGTEWRIKHILTLKGEQ